MEASKSHNPRWGSANYTPLDMQVSYDHRTEFEKVVNRLGLKRAECLYSPELRRWIEHHYQHRYVPEELLEAMGLVVFVT